MSSLLRLSLLWLFILLLPCDGQKQVLLSQIPRWVLRQPGGTTQIKCYQDNTDHTWMYWYQQKAADQPLKLIGSLAKGDSAALEGGFKGTKLMIQPEEDKHCSLQITDLRSEDTAMYFCASSDHSAENFQELPTKTELYSFLRKGNSTYSACYESVVGCLEGKGFSYSLLPLCSGYELHFGPGTRLTVLEEGQVTSPPNVTIFAPSTQELQKTKKVTIVCLATNFFPDHVNLTWSVNGENRTEGVKTEEPIYKATEKTYSLISRLRITSKEWQNPRNNFKCSVDFYNETGKSTYDDTITGVECSSSSAKEKYLRDTNFGKLVYILLICKSALYGAVVMGLKLRRKLMP
ncbi:M1-specific T cell receptor beta chain-like [Elgaria multicarinata webbii]|uniref:M1-specific T cell receptor beta chain-like n=1 Tax=Elgaria multicarinata webbii TaxID=159646 RepID=UPI002FCCE9B1